jgi:serpin B
VCLFFAALALPMACQKATSPVGDAGTAVATDAGTPLGDAGTGPLPDSGLTGVFAEDIVGPSNCGQPPAADGGTIASVVQGNSALSIQLLNQLAAEDSGQNIFYSPLSISTALAMVYQGAVGATATQLASGLNFSLPAGELATGFGALACELEANGQAPDGGQIDLANAVFGQQGDSFQAPFETTLQNSFGAPFTPVDFETNPDGVRQQIDGWVSQQTQGMIPNLLGPGSITSDMKLVLVDALYFNELWPTPFDPATTGSFHVSSSQTVQVPLLTDAIQLTGYYSGADAVVAELPFTNAHEAIDFVLPGTATGTLSALEAGLTTAEIQSWFSGLTAQTVLVTIPKFKIDWASSLIPAFQALGVSAPFQAGQADFSGIDGQTDLFISLLQHEAVLEVNETGVTAAAATAVGIAGNAAPEWTETFSATQPFLVIIRDKPTGAVLFVGQVTNPAG